MFFMSKFTKKESMYAIKEKPKLEDFAIKCETCCSNCGQCAFSGIDQKSYTIATFEWLEQFNINPHLKVEKSHVS